MFDQIKEAVCRLQNDEAIGFPTETVYGLAASLDSEIAIKKIFEIKQRPFFDPLIVHISSNNQLSLVTEYFNHPDVLKLIETFWPGPLSIVLPKTNYVNPLITSGLDTVAVRMPDNKFALEIIDKLGIPVAAPSANIFSKTSPTCYNHVKESFQNIFIVDGGPSVIGIESTVIEPCFNGTIKILRPGIITERDLLSCFNSNIKIVQDSSMASPGNLKHHYMPEIPLVLCYNKNIDLALEEYSLKENIANINAFELILSKDPRVAARELYQKLREVPSSYNLVYFLVPEFLDEIWYAIMDRLTRAASFISSPDYE